MYLIIVDMAKSGSSFLSYFFFFLIGCFNGGIDDTGIMASIWQEKQAWFWIIDVLLICILNLILVT